MEISTVELLNIFHGIENGKKFCITDGVTNENIVEPTNNIELIKEWLGNQDNNTYNIVYILNNEWPIINIGVERA